VSLILNKMLSEIYEEWQGAFTLRHAYPC